MIFSKKPVVAHIRLKGVIGNVGRFQQGLSLASNEAIIKKAFETKKLSAVAISINSPGGSPVQSKLIYSLIRRLAEEKKVKVLNGYGVYLATVFDTANQKAGQEIIDNMRKAHENTKYFLEKWNKQLDKIDGGSGYW